MMRILMMNKVFLGIQNNWEMHLQTVLIIKEYNKNKFLKNRKRNSIIGNLIGRLDLCK